MMLDSGLASLQSSKDGIVKGFYRAYRNGWMRHSQLFEEARCSILLARYDTKRSSASRSMCTIVLYTSANTPIESKLSDAESLEISV